MTLMGWCVGPEGARPPHDRCRARYVGADGVERVCGCPCHTGQTVPKCETMGTNKRPLGGASTPLIQGASPTLDRSVD